VSVQNNQDALNIQRGNQVGQIIVQNEPNRTATQALKTVPVSQNIAAIPALNANAQQIALAPNSQAALGVGGNDPYTVQGAASASTLPYVVAVPDRGTGTVNKVQSVVPGAYRAQSSRGVYVYAGSFANRTQAEDLSQQLQQAGLDARVAFRP
jgi:cell division protein FtsN